MAGADPACGWTCRPSRLFPCRRTISPISLESVRASNPPASLRPPDVDNPMDGGGESPVAVMTVVHRMRKVESNLLGVSCAFGDYDYKLNAKLLPS